VRSGVAIMSTMINSGILYLENFVEKHQLLPSDLSRQLNYIRSLDERISGMPSALKECTQICLLGVASIILLLKFAQS
jgi:hypothetical protein